MEARTSFVTEESDIDPDVPPELFEACTKYLEEGARRIEIERRDGRNGYRKTGKRIRIREDVEDISAEEMASEAWELARRHALSYGTCVYTWIFFAADGKNLGKVRHDVCVDDQKEKSKDGELVSVVSMFRGFLEQQHEHQLALVSKVNQMAEQNSQSMRHLTDAKIAEMHYTAQREANAAASLMHEEEMKANMAKWQAIGQFAGSLGTRLGDFLVDRFSDSWKDPGATAFQTAWKRFPAKDELVLALPVDLREWWAAMAQTDSEETWESIARAYDPSRGDLGPAVNVIMENAGPDLPIWIQLARRGGWSR